MSDKSYHEKLDKIQSDLNLIIWYITNQNRPVHPVPQMPYPSPIDPMIGLTKCHKCGMEFRGVTGYVCSDMKCPTFAKAYFGVTSISNTGGNWRILNEGSKE